MHEKETKEKENCPRIPHFLTASGCKDLGFSPKVDSTFMRRHKKLSVFPPGWVIIYALINCCPTCAHAKYCCVDKPVHMLRVDTDIL